MKTPEEIKKGMEDAFCSPTDRQRGGRGMKTRKALLEEIEKLKEEVRRWMDIATEKNKMVYDLQEQLEKISRGERCYGSHCECCAHAIEVMADTILTEDGFYIYPGTHEIICALSVPCPDFKREEE